MSNLKRDIPDWFGNVAVDRHDSFVQKGNKMNFYLIEMFFSILFSLKAILFFSASINGIMVRVFTYGLGDRGSILGQVILKKW